MSGIIHLTLIPILIALIIGLYIGHLLPPFIFNLRIFSLPIILFIWILLSFRKLNLLSSLMAILFFFMFGIISIQNYLFPLKTHNDISNFHNIDPILVEGIVEKPPHRSYEKTRIIIRSEKVIISNRVISVQGNLITHIKEKSEPIMLGDRIRLWCRLKAPHGFRNPGVFSYERHLAFENIYTIALLKSDRAWVKIGEGFKNPILLRIEKWRQWIRDFLEREANPECSGIFKALVLGEQQYVLDNVKENFINTGIAHLLAISGDHLGIVALISFSLFLWLFKRSELLLLSVDIKKLAAFLTIPCIILYTFIAGSGISIIRATLMVCIFFFSILFNRERNLLYTLGLSAFIILILSPSSLYDVSFQLSFLAVFSILYLAPKVFEGLRSKTFIRDSSKGWRKKILNYLKISLIVTTLATLGTAPFVVLHFNRISIIGILTNILAIPWVGFLIVPLSLFASFLSFFFYPIATILIHVNDILTISFLRIISFFSSFPYACLNITTPTFFEMIIFYTILSLSIHIKKNERIRLLFISLLILLIIDIGYWEVKGFFKKDLTITFLDVGHGDSILVEFPKGKRMLIDGGGLYQDDFDIGKNVIAPFLYKKKIRNIDILVLTHPDPDHFKGLRYIVSKFSIGEFWSNGLREESEAYIQLEEKIKDLNIKKFIKDEESSPIKVGDVTLLFLNPPEERKVSINSSSDINNSSIVIKLLFKNFTALFTGDIEKEAELRLIKKGYQLKSDLLKIPHHGSLSSSSQIFVNHVKPIYAIVSVGDYGLRRLPHQDVLHRYKQLGSIILGTNEHGAIEIKTDGEKILAKTSTSFHPRLHQIHLQKNLHRQYFP